MDSTNTHADRAPQHGDHKEIRMNSRTAFTLSAALAALILSLPAASLAPIHENCTISASEKAGDGDCSDHSNCGSNFSNDSFSRFTGIALSDLSREAAQLTATLNAEAGVFACAGTVHSGELAGQSTFTPSEEFVQRMGRLGFSGYDSEKLQAYALIGVESAWAESLQQAGIRGITIDNLIALHIFKVDPTYVRSLNDLGYKTPDADQLIGLKVQGVNAEEIRQIRALGYEPTLDELVQIRIFHITPDFIHRMQARGLKDLTISKLVQIKIFKLDE
jgi:hypothetical protein